MDKQVQSTQEFVRGLMVVGVSFIVAFCIQVIVHELGHYIAGIFVGATGGRVILSAFGNSKVIFSHTPGGSAQVIIGVMGIVLDMVLACSIGIMLWNKKHPVLLPLMLWGSIAFIGEGIGMISSLGVYPEYIEDITNLLPLGVPSELILMMSILMVIVGLIWMVLIMPQAGIGLEVGFIKRFMVYFCCLPLYFLIAMAYIQLFTPMSSDMLEVRGYQLMISLLFAIVLSVFHKPISRILGNFIKPKELTIPQKSDLAILVGVAVFLLGSLEIYARL